MSEVLQVHQGVAHVDDITGVRYHTYTPYSTSFQNNDEIRITIQSQDLYVQPSESHLIIEFTPVKRGGTPIGEKEAYFTALSGVHFFNEMRYELNGVEIDRCKLPAITSQLKTMIACKTTDMFDMKVLTLLNGSFLGKKIYRLTIPLKFMFGFCDDYNKVILNSKHTVRKKS